MANISVSNAGPVQPNINQASQIAEVQQKTGAGSIAQSGAVPDPLGQNYEMISQSLSKFFPALTGDQIDTLVAEATLKLKEIVGETGTQELNAKEEQKRQSQAERRETAAESQQQLEDAKASAAKAKKSSGWGKFFNALIIVATVVAAVALMATGAGVAAGIALLVVAAASTVQLADQIVKEQTGFGIAGNIAINKQMDDGATRAEAEQAAMKADKVFGIAMTVVIVVASIVAMRPDKIAQSLGPKLMQMGSSLMARGASTGAQTAATASQAGSTAANAANAAKAADTARTAAHLSEKTAKMAYHGANGVSAVATAGSASTQIASAKLNSDAANRTADANELQGKALDLQALTDSLDDAIDEIMSRISGENSIFNAMLDNVSTSVKDRGDTFARARFAG